MNTLAFVFTLGVPAAGSLLMGFITVFFGSENDGR